MGRRDHYSIYLLNSSVQLQTLSFILGSLLLKKQNKKPLALFKISAKYAPRTHNKSIAVWTSFYHAVPTIYFYFSLVKT